MIEHAAFVPYLTGMVNLRLYWESGGGDFGNANLEEALAIADLGNAVNRKVKTYSQGMRQRLGIARALLGRPDVLVLDEPTNGLDPGEIREVRDLLRRLADRGDTVLLSSHLLSEVEQVCSHAVVMDKGRLVAYGRGRAARPGVDVGLRRGRRQRPGRAGDPGPARHPQRPPRVSRPRRRSRRRRAAPTSSPRWCTPASPSTPCSRATASRTPSWACSPRSDDVLKLFSTEMSKQWRRPRTYVALGLTMAVPLIIVIALEGEPTVAATRLRRHGRPVLLPFDEDRTVPPGRRAARDEPLPARHRRRAVRWGRDRVGGELGEPARAARPADRTRPPAGLQARVGRAARR